MFRLQIKHDILHKKYHLLSVKSYLMLPLRNDIELYLNQYAHDNNMNHDLLSVQLIDDDNNVLYTHHSNVYMNNPKNHLHNN